MASASDTIIILDALQVKGFNDEAFSCLHHSQEAGRDDSIAAHRRYCEKTQSFAEGSNNHKVQERLALVLRSYVLGVYNSGEPAVFIALAKAAYAEIS